MLDTAYQYLIDSVDSLIEGYSETLPREGQAITFRCTNAEVQKNLNGRRYYTYSFNAIVRGGKDSSALTSLCDSITVLIDLEQTADIIQCNVTSEPIYAYKDENGNLHYSFGVDVII